MPHTDAFGADCKFVLLSSVTIEESEQLITSAWSNTLNVDCNEQTLQMVYSFTLCCEFIYIGMKSSVEKKGREDV